MSNTSVKYYFGSFVWNVVSKVLDAGLKFFTIPLLLVYFGRVEYGIITLAISTNAYMQLLNMGINVGAVKFFSQWIESKKFSLLNRVVRTNLTVYTGIGIINAVILLSLAFWGRGVFNITDSQFLTLRSLLYIMAAFSVASWVTLVFNQLLIANEQIGFTQKMLSIRSLLNLGLVLFTVNLSWTIQTYFLLFTIVNVFVLIPYLTTCLRKGLITSIIPAFYWRDFNVVFKYSVAILAMSIFQFTASQSRPLVLGMFSLDGISVLSDYRILEVFPMFAISIGGALISILLPKMAKIVEANDIQQLRSVAYNGTKYTSILAIALTMPIVINAKSLLAIYVGLEYTHLYQWLIIWMVTIVLLLHNSPVSSIVLATGKTRMLVVSSAISCVISLLANIILCKYFAVGSAVIAYLIYIVIQISFYYFYFNSKILDLNSFKVFKSFIVPTLLSIIPVTLLYFTHLENMLIVDNVKLNSILVMMLETGIFFLIYTLLLQFFKVVSFRELRGMIKK